MAIRSRSQDKDIQAQENACYCSEKVYDDSKVVYCVSENHGVQETQSDRQAEHSAGQNQGGPVSPRNHAKRGCSCIDEEMRPTVVNNESIKGNRYAGTLQD